MQTQSRLAFGHDGLARNHETLVPCFLQSSFAGTTTRLITTNCNHVNDATLNVRASQFSHSLTNSHGNVVKWNTVD